MPSATRSSTAGIELGGGVRSPYPKGLLVGQVVDVRRDANGVVQTAYLQPAAPISTSSSTLLVITDYQGGLPPIEQQPVDCGTGGDAARRASSHASCRAPSPSAEQRARESEAVTPACRVGFRCYASPR